MLHNKDQDAVLRMWGAQNNSQPIECLPPDKEKQTLGVQQCPVGSNIDEFEHLTDVVTVWRAEVKTSCLDHKG